MNATSTPCCDDDDEDDEGEAADMEGIPVFTVEEFLSRHVPSPLLLLLVSEYEESGLLETDEV